MSKKKPTRAQQDALETMIATARARGDIDFIKLCLDVAYVLVSTSLLDDDHAYESAVLSRVAGEHPNLMDRMAAGLRGPMIGLAGGAL